MRRPTVFETVTLGPKSQSRSGVPWSGESRRESGRSLRSSGRPPGKGSGLGDTVIFVDKAAIIERAGRVLANAASSPARVILFGSGARDTTTADSDLDFLVIERSVDDRIAEAVRLRRALGDIGVPVDIVVLDEAVAERRAKVPGTMVHSAMRDGRLIAQS